MSHEYFPKVWIIVPNFSENVNHVLAHKCQNCQNSWLNLSSKSLFFMIYPITRLIWPIIQVTWIFTNYHIKSHYYNPYKIVVLQRHLYWWCWWFNSHQRHAIYDLRDGIEWCDFDQIWLCTICTFYYDKNGTMTRNEIVRR